MSTQLIHKQVPVGEPVLKNTLVFLVEAYLKPVLDYSSKIGHCEVDFHNVHIKLCQISMEIQTVLEQEIIKLVKLSATESIGDIGFSFPKMSIGTRSLIRIKCIGKLAKYIGQLFISILIPTRFGP